MRVVRNFKTGKLVEPDREYAAISHRLWWWREHCETAHGATDNDYQMRVQEWHRENHPDCEARYV